MSREWHNYVLSLHTVINHKFFISIAYFNIHILNYTVLKVNIFHLCICYVSFVMRRSEDGYKSGRNM